MYGFFFKISNRNDNCLKILLITTKVYKENPIHYLFINRKLFESELHSYYNYYIL